MAETLSRGWRPGRASGLAGLVLGCTIVTLASGCSTGSAASSATPFDGARAWRDLEAQVALGPRPSGSEAIEGTRKYIEAQLVEAGLAPVREPFVERSPAGEIEFCNVYADLAGRSDGGAPPILILLSHFDTKRLGPSFVGANDGGSSTAVLLELARVLARQGPRAMTIRFLFVDGEEAVGAVWEDPDNRYGSRHHAARIHADADLAERVKACVVIDMVGDKDLDLVLDRNSSKRLLDVFFDTAKAHKLPIGLGRKVDNISDDHLSFRTYNVEAADLIDLTYGPGNSYWHTDEDTLDKCSVESLQAIGDLVLLALPAVEARYVPGG